ncbi:MAG: hypothetical protein ACUZ8E_13945 [Candidatus Anammoxibacter sp.]
MIHKYLILITVVLCAISCKFESLAKDNVRPVIRNPSAKGLNLLEAVRLAILKHPNIHLDEKQVKSSKGILQAQRCPVRNLHVRLLSYPNAFIGYPETSSTWIPAKNLRE